MALRVLHLVPQFPYFGGRRIVGGYAASVLALTAAQQARGHAVTIAGATLKATPGQTYAGAEIISLARVECAGSLRFYMNLALGWLRAARMARGAFDVIHIHSGYVEYCALSFAVRVIFGRRVTHTIYCPLVTSGPRRAVQWLIVRIVSKAIVLTSMSRNVSQSLQSIGGSDIGVLPPAIDVRHWSCDSRGIHSPPRLLFVGNASHEKNLESVIVACGSLAKLGHDFELHVTLELARTSSEPSVAALADLARRVGVSSKLHPHGIVDDMRALLCSVDVHIAPFRSTIGPSDYFISSLEAMAAGRAVIVSNLPGMREVIADTHNGLVVNPEDPHELAGAILRALEPEAHREMADRARSTVAESYDADKCAGLADDLYARTTST